MTLLARKSILASQKPRRSFDPTHTTVIRKAFVSQMNKRFIRLTGAIRQAIVVEDCFDLRPNLVLLAGGHATPGPKAFGFGLSSDKVDGFMDWLKTQEQEGILDISYAQQVGQGYREPWTNAYIQSCYQKGIQSSRVKLHKAGYPVGDIELEGGIQAVMNGTVHADRAGLAYSRTYNELKGVTAHMDQGISRVLAQGLADGLNPMTMAAGINQVIRGKDGLVRARMIARTETIRAHHVATIQEYKNYGVEGVNVQAELVTAGYDVCDECLSKELGNPYTLKKIEGMIPVHPNCRCSTIPVDITDKKKKRVRKAPVQETVKKAPTKSKRVVSPGEVKKVLNEQEEWAIEEWSSSEVCDDVRSLQLDPIKFAQEHPSKVFVEEYKEISQFLDDAIKKIPDSELPLYRGLHELPDEVLTQFKTIGSEIEFKSVASFTDEAVNATFFTDAGSKRSVILRVMNGKGTNISVAEIHESTGINEFLVQRGRKFKVVGTSKEKMMEHYVQGELKNTSSTVQFIDLEEVIE